MFAVSFDIVRNLTASDTPRTGKETKQKGRGMLMPEFITDNIRSHATGQGIKEETHCLWARGQHCLAAMAIRR